MDWDPGGRRLLVVFSWSCGITKPLKAIHFQGISLSSVIPPERFLVVGFAESEVERQLAESVTAVLVGEAAVLARAKEAALWRSEVDGLWGWRVTSIKQSTACCWGYHPSLF